MPKSTPSSRTATTPSSAIQYRVSISRPEAHLLTVECTVPAPDPAGETFALPAWIPGSYLIRDFARHVISLTASADGKAATVRKTAVDHWQVIPPAGASQLLVTIEIYAWDLSVRSAHVDTRHAFFNGTSVFLRVLGRESSACSVEFVPPKGKNYKAWRVATAMPRAGSTGSNEFGHYQAANYAELIDHPVEMGTFDLIEFGARGVRHDVALTGVHRADLDRLRHDLKQICAWELGFWGKPYPIARYLFLTTCVGDGYGGLEHRASTALLCKRNDLPKPGTPSVAEGYRNFLGLVAHEYFHTWLIKRIQPAEFAQPEQPNLQGQNPTELLWLFEGFTSYYDDLCLLRCGLISVHDYLICLSKTIANVQGTPGRFRQSVAAASFDAWIKFYKPDENTPNATVSYYAKGALVALALDLMIRESTSGERSLDNLMRRLWNEYGMTGTGVAESDVRRIAGELGAPLDQTGLDQFFAQALHGTDDLPLHELLAGHGIELSYEGGGGPSLGVKLDGNEPKIACAYEGGAAQAAGLSGGDTLIAMNGLRITAGNLDTLLADYRVGDHVTIHAFRRDELGQFEVTLAAAPPTTCHLEPAGKPARRARRLRELWLSRDTS